MYGLYQLTSAYWGIYKKVWATCPSTRPEIKSVNPWCDRPRFFHFIIGLRHLLHISRKSRMLHGMIPIWLPHSIYDWIKALSGYQKTIVICDWIKYLSFLRNTTSSQIYHNVPEWGRIRLATLGWFRSDRGTMWLGYMDLVKPVTYISNHANIQFTYLRHICHKKLIHCSEWLAKWYALSVTRTSVFKTQ